MISKITQSDLGSRCKVTKFDLWVDVSAVHVWLLMWCIIFCLPDHAKELHGCFFSFSHRYICRRDIDPGCFHHASSKQIWPIQVEQEQIIWQRNCKTTRGLKREPASRRTMRINLKSTDNRLSLPEVLGL